MNSLQPPKHKWILLIFLAMVLTSPALSQTGDSKNVQPIRQELSEHIPPLQKPTDQDTLTSPKISQKPAVQQASFEKEREIYQEALGLIRSGNWKALREKRKQLAGYPLYPYLIYADLTVNMRTSRHKEITAFLEAHDGTVSANRLQYKWLQHLIRYDNWRRYLTFFKPQGASVSQQCYYHLAQYRDGDRQKAIQAGLKLWTVGKSQPKGCDKLFGILVDGKHISEEIAWERFNKALLSHQYQLARYLKRFFTSAHYLKMYQVYYDVDRKPYKIGRYSNFNEKSGEESSLIEHGLTRLARQDANNALKHWSRYQQTHSFTENARANITGSIVKALYKQGHTKAADSYFRDNLALLNGDFTEWRIREALREQDWATLRQWLAQLTEEEQQRSIWQYWKIRSLESDPTTTHNPDIDFLKATLAKERDFYGFMASEMLQKEYSLNHIPVDIDPTNIERISTLPAVQRAREFLFHKDFLNANREWHAATQQFDYSDWLAASIVASQWHWHHKAIASLGQAKYWDDVEVRFPLAYQEQIEQSAKQTGIPNYTLFALARQESAFNPTATSSAGAMGLIQVMPSTAKSTARQYKIPYRHKSQLHDVNTNVSIGAHYYKKMLERFDNNRILATAAYNAGPHRVTRWLAESDSKLPFDIWIELIPFKETRSYVRNVLMYSVIYSRKLSMNAPMLDKHERERLL